MLRYVTEVADGVLFKGYGVNLKYFFAVTEAYFCAVAETEAL
jgi:hypothetical protein